MKISSDEIQRIARRCVPQTYGEPRPDDRATHSAASEYVARLGIAGTPAAHITAAQRSAWTSAHSSLVGDAAMTGEAFDKAVQATKDGRNRWLTWLAAEPTDAERNAVPDSPSVAKLLAVTRVMCHDDCTFKLAGQTVARIVGRYSGTLPDREGGRTILQLMVRRGFIEIAAATRPTTYRLKWRPPPSLPKPADDIPF